MEKWLNSISGPWLYVVAGVLTFAETGTLFFLVPGEVGLFVAGAAAGAGHLNVVLMAVIACVAAVAGDATGFWIGKRWGRRVQTTWLGTKLGPDNWTRAERLIVERRGMIILVGRWIGFLRAIMPASAGMAGMSYRRFLPWDIAGAISWATLCVVGGYELGDNWKRLASVVGKVGWGLAVLAAMVVAIVVLRRRRVQRSTT